MTEKATRKWEMGNGSTFYVVGRCDFMLVASCYLLLAKTGGYCG